MEVHSPARLPHPHLRFQGGPATPRTDRTWRPPSSRLTASSWNRRQGVWPSPSPGTVVKGEETHLHVAPRVVTDGKAAFGGSQATELTVVHLANHRIGNAHLAGAAHCAERGVLPRPLTPEMGRPHPWARFQTPASSGGLPRPDELPVPLKLDQNPSSHLLLLQPGGGGGKGKPGNRTDRRAPGHHLIDWRPRPDELPD